MGRWKRPDPCECPRCTSPCHVNRSSEANVLYLQRCWASQSPSESNPRSYTAVWASPRPPVLHLKFSAPSILADCHVEWWDRQAESSGRLGMGLQNGFLKRIPSFREKWLYKKYIWSPELNELVTHESWL